MRARGMWDGVGHVGEAARRLPGFAPGIALLLAAGCASPDGPPVEVFEGGARPKAFRAIGEAETVVGSLGMRFGEPIERARRQALARARAAGADCVILVDQHDEVRVRSLREPAHVHERVHHFRWVLARKEAPAAASTPPPAPARPAPSPVVEP